MHRALPGAIVDAPAVREQQQVVEARNDLRVRLVYAGDDLRVPYLKWSEKVSGWKHYKLVSLHSYRSVGVCESHEAYDQLQSRLTVEPRCWFVEHDNPRVRH